MEPTVFNSVTNTAPFSGTGVNSYPLQGVSLSNYLQSFNNMNWSRLVISGPTDGSIYFNDTAFDSLWMNSTEFSSSIRFSNSILQNAGTTVIFTIGSGFLENNSRNILTGDLITAYARYFVSLIYCLKTNFSISVTFVELVDKLTLKYITPPDYLVLIQIFRGIMSSRGLSGVSVLGPGIKMLKSGVLSNAYIESFIGTTGIIDAWSFHAVESDEDKNLFQNSTFAARNYFFTRAMFTVAMMQRTLPYIPIYVTKFTSIASIFSSGIDFGPSASDVIEYSLRLSDNFCGLLNANISNILFYFLKKDNDPKSLFRNDGSKRTFTQALNLLSQDSFFNSGTLFNLVSVDSNDQTIKAAIVGENSYVLILSRAQSTDSFLGNILVDINGTWSGNYLATSTIDVFPSSVDTSRVVRTCQVSNLGVLSITLTKVPYSCIIIVKGTVYPVIPLVPQPVFESISLPVVSVLPSTGNSIGDTVYLVPDNHMYTYVNNVWVLIHPGM